MTTLPILYRDAHLVAINKPAGIPVHRSALDRHAADAAAEGVRIVSLAPGVVDTAMQAGMRVDPAFPLREQFAALHADGKLQSAAATAAQILAYCQSDQFAREPIADIRTL